MAEACASSGGAFPASLRPSPPQVGAGPGRPETALGTILLRVLSQVVQGAGAGLDSGLQGLKLMPRTLSRGCGGRTPKMLLTMEAWRLGGTLLGDAVVCEQMTVSGNDRCPPESPRRCPPHRSGSGDVEPSSPARHPACRHGQPLPLVAIPPQYHGPHGELLLQRLSLYHKARAVPHRGGLKTSLLQSFSPVGGRWPNFPN